MIARLSDRLPRERLARDHQQRDRSQDREQTRREHLDLDGALHLGRLVGSGEDERRLPLGQAVDAALERRKIGGTPLQPHVRERAVHQPPLVEVEERGGEVQRGRQVGTQRGELRG